MATPQDPAYHPTIKPATRDDVADILALIHELAAYENASSSVVATEQSLARTLTFATGGTSTAPTNAGYARCVMLYTPRKTLQSKSSSSEEEEQESQEEGGKLAGFALYFNNYSTWRAQPGIFLEDLFVRPAFRGKGYGTLMMRFLAAEVLRMDGGRLEWSCLKWNESSLKFYEGLGAERMEGWVGLRVEGEDLMRLARGKVPAAKRAKEEGKEGVEGGSGLKNEVGGS